MRIVLSGPLATVAGQGGLQWVVLHWLGGLRALGHDVVFVEPVDLPPGTPLARSPAARALPDVLAGRELEGRAALLAAGARETVGLEWRELHAACRDADLLVNLSGLLKDEALLAAADRRLYVDLDPAFTQLWHAVEGLDMGLEGHTHHATVGLAIGDPGCPIPTCGLDWIPILPPVDLGAWTRAPLGLDAFTTVANWRGYGSIDHDGVFYGQKAHSLRPLIELPRRTDARFVLALGIHPDERRDLEALAAHGWKLVDPLESAGDPERYRAFVRGSRAELGIAKSGYVVSRSGWFSDRSACYLAAGRPVLAQDTGIGDRLEIGEGLLTFATVDDALAGVEAIRADYDRHGRAARELAVARLDAPRVLEDLLDRVGAAGGTRGLGVTAAARPLAGGGIANEARDEVADAARAAVERALEREVVAVERRPSPYASSAPLEDVDVRLDDGRVIELVFKDLSPAAQPIRARRARPAFVTDPARSIEAHRVIVPRAPAGPPRCWDAIAEPDRGRYWLFLERVPGLRLQHVGELEAWEAAARWLGAFHARFEDAPPADAPSLLRYDADHARLWMRRALVYLTPGASPEDAGRLHELAARHEAVVARFAALPSGVIHGEYYAENVLVVEEGEGLRVAPVDWERVAWGPLALDVAGLVAGAWSEDEKARLVRAYREGWPPDRRPEEARLAAAVALARFQHAIQWLGWFGRRSPPAWQAQNWIGEAEAMARMLDG